MKLLALAASLGLLYLPALSNLAVAGDEASEPQLVLQYDFFDVQGSRVPDGSGHGHAGSITAGTIVSGRRKPAVQLGGAGMVATDSRERIGFAGRAMTVGAMCRPAAADGVIVSMGDSTDGFSLYLRDGAPHFAVRSSGELREVADPEPLDLGQWVHLAGVIDASGGLSLLVNAFPVAKLAGKGLPTHTPAGALVVGAEAGARVGFAAPRWQGLLEDVRLYSGAISREAHRDLLGDWADRPGCGCRK